MKKRALAMAGVMTLGLLPGLGGIPAFAAQEKAYKDNVVQLDLDDFYTRTKVVETTVTVPTTGDSNKYYPWGVNYDYYYAYDYTFTPEKSGTYDLKTEVDYSELGVDDSCDPCLFLLNDDGEKLCEDDDDDYVDTYNSCIYNVELEKGQRYHLLVALRNSNNIRQVPISIYQCVPNTEFDVNWKNETPTLTYKQGGQYLSELAVNYAISMAASKLNESFSPSMVINLLDASPVIKMLVNSYWYDTSSVYSLYDQIESIDIQIDGKTVSFAPITDMNAKSADKKGYMPSNSYSVPYLFEGKTEDTTYYFYTYDAIEVSTNQLGDVIKKILSKQFALEESLGGMIDMPEDILAEWTPGGTNKLYFEVFGASKTYDVDIADTIVKSVEFTPVEERTMGFTNGIALGPSTYYYFVDFYPGDKVTVTFADDTTKTYTAYYSEPASVKPGVLKKEAVSSPIMLPQVYFLDEEDKLADVDIKFISDQFNGFWGIGENNYYIEVNGVRSEAQTFTLTNDSTADLTVTYSGAPLIARPSGWTIGADGKPVQAYYITFDRNSTDTPKLTVTDKSTAGQTVNDEWVYTSGQFVKGTETLSVVIDNQYENTSIDPLSDSNTVDIYIEPGLCAAAPVVPVASNKDENIESIKFKNIGDIVIDAEEAEERIAFEVQGKQFEPLSDASHEALDKALKDLIIEVTYTDGTTADYKFNGSTFINATNPEDYLSSHYEGFFQVVEPIGSFYANGEAEIGLAWGDYYQAVTATVKNSINPVQNGWEKTKDGKWTYKKNYESVTGWVQDDGKWYFLDEDGVMKTGWLQDGSKWYYLDGTGAMRTGWVKVGAKWYFFNTKGAMQTGWVKDGKTWYYCDAKGAMQTGWFQDGKTWYYLGTDGKMVTEWKKIGTNWYYFGTDGKMVVGWKKIGTVWYYFNTNGSMKTGWLKDGNSWYYLKSSGAMAASESIKIGSKTYSFNAKGVCTNP